MPVQIEFLASLSKNEKLCNQHGGNNWITQEGFLNGDFLTLNKKEKTVKWYSKGGTAVLRSFQFESEPLDAVFCLLNVDSVDSSGPEDPTTTDDKRLCIAVLVSTNELHIYYQSGEKFEMLLPASCKYLLATSRGLLLQGTIFNVIENVVLDDTMISPPAENNNDGNPHPHNDTNVVLFLHSPHSSVDIISTTLQYVPFSFVI
jgi:hypothetical protein